MKLQEFVSETLKEIIAGVKEAKSFAASQGAMVNPPIDRGGRPANLIKDVEFDVAVISTEGTETKKGAGIFVAGIGVGAKGKVDMSNSTVSRIKFSVPVILPAD